MTNLHRQITSVSRYIVNCVLVCLLSCRQIVHIVDVKVTCMFQVNLYTGALFIQQSLGWDLYLSILLQIGIVAILTVTGMHAFVRCRHLYETAREQRRVGCRPE